MSGDGLNNPAAIDTLALEATLEDVGEDVTAIREVTDVEPVLEETGGTLTTDGNVQNIYINNAPAGIYKPTWFNINFTNHTAGETVVLRSYHRNVAGGAWVRDDNTTFAGVPTDLLVWIELHPTRFGIQITIEKTVGTNRAYVWEVFYEVAP